MASSMRCLLYNPSFPLERDHAFVAPFPHLAATTPFPTRLRPLCTQWHLGTVDTHAHHRGRGKTRRRFPRAFRDNYLHGLEALLPLRIEALAHTHESVTILREQWLRAFLPWFEMEEYPHHATPYHPFSDYSSVTQRSEIFWSFDSLEMFPPHLWRLTPCYTLRIRQS
jgi:hypothetical protein